MTGLETELRALVAEFAERATRALTDIVRAEIAKANAATTKREAFLSTREAATFAGVADGTIRRWIREGRIVGHRAGRHVRVERADIERLIRRSPVGLSPEQLAERDFG